MALADCFAVSVLSYAVMSNHFHIVAHVNPTQPENWTNREVALRWLRAFPGLLRGCRSTEQTEATVKNLLADEHWVATIRQRLGNLSWFMRALNEPIARKANKEDNCTGRFWEGRFKCQALLDQKAILACMAYVDLNPYRALGKIDLETAMHTSLRKRLSHQNDRPQNSERDIQSSIRLDAVAGPSSQILLSVREDEYLDVVFWTALKAYNLRQTNVPKSSSVEIPNWLNSQDTSSLAWIIQVKGTERLFYRAIGSLLNMTNKAKQLKQQWLKGIGTCRMLADLSKN
jgi:hypothetical protein